MYDAHNSRMILKKFNNIMDAIDELVSDHGDEVLCIAHILRARELLNGALKDTAHEIYLDQSESTERNCG